MRSPKKKKTPYIRFIHKVTLSLGLLSPSTYPLFQWPSKKFLLNLSMKCWNSASNTQGLRVIIVVLQVGPVKIYVAAVVSLPPNWWFSEFHPSPLNASELFFAGFFSNQIFTGF